MSPSTFSPVGVRRRLTGWGCIALAAGLAGLVASVDILSPLIQAPLVAFMVFLGPGAVVRNWLSVAPATGAVLVPSIGVAVIILLTTAMAALQLWHPTALLIGLSLAVLAG
ncbi:MAG: hypothetical protein JWQ43_934, partial [Glaciihabitans sp.]|nr:hypothetical protein [Glaciihabitans sp.]